MTSMIQSRRLVLFIKVWGVLQAFQVTTPKSSLYNRIGYPESRWEIMFHRGSDNARTTGYWVWSCFLRGRGKDASLIMILVYKDTNGPLSILDYVTVDALAREAWCFLFFFPPCLRQNYYTPLSRCLYAIYKFHDEFLMGLAALLTRNCYDRED
ncbi:hypothetical protein F5Y01DRAFT_127202 [Xylaria sp. FL0043]|nr:hypothetical protein F5Y01DRAFT_127202 [Xylaria sp. FL0043]